MNPIHEIAFLVLSGAISCLPGAQTDAPCLEPDKIKISAYRQPDLREKPVKTDGNPIKSYLSTEVGYEESGLAVFKILNNEWFQIMSRSGEAYWLHLPTETAKNKELWRVETIENLVGQGLARVDSDYLNYLRKEDLKTPQPVPKEVFEKIHDRQFKALLEEMKVELPVAFIDVTMPCTYKEISPGTSSGKCQAAPHVMAYEIPSASADRMEVSMNLGHWNGIAVMDADSATHTERLYILSEESNWLKIQVNFGDENKRKRWVKKSDLGKFEIRKAPAKEQVAALIQILKSSGDTHEAEKIRYFKPETEFSTTGKTKWSSDGVLWAEVDIQDINGCSGEEPNKLLKAWLPYKIKRDRTPILSWYARGC